MGEHRNGRGYECLAIDLNTQRDFCDGNGAAPVSNLSSLIPALRRTIAWVKWNCAPIVSSLESTRPFELSDSGTPICCVDGSGGQHKLGFTIFPLRKAIEVDNSLGFPTDIFRHVQQVILRKRGDNLLGNPKADRLFSHVPVTEYVVFGTGLEGSIKTLALALRVRAKQVTVVTDACGFWDRADAELATRQMAAKGVKFVTTDELLVRKLEGRARRRQRWAMAASASSMGALNGTVGKTKSGLRRTRSTSALPRTARPNRHSDASPQS